LAALAAVTLLPGCWEGSVLSQEAEWARGIEVYYVEARIAAEQFLAGDQVMQDLQDKAMTEDITEEDLQVGYDAVKEMTNANQAWVELEVPDPEIYDAHMAVEEAMRLVRSADKELLGAIETGTMDRVSDANADREAALAEVNAALDEVEAWYDDNERRIQRGLRNAE
jgi:hypothetical protein